MRGRTLRCCCLFARWRLQDAQQHRDPVDQRRHQAQNGHGSVVMTVWIFEPQLLEPAYLRFLNK